MIGHEGHPEVEGTQGRIPGGVHLELTGLNVTECVGGPDDIKDENLGDSGDILAAFSGDEVRGVSAATLLEEGQVPPGADVGTYVFFLTIGSSSNGEVLTFKLYDSSEDQVLN